MEEGNALPVRQPLLSIYFVKDSMTFSTAEHKTQNRSFDGGRALTSFRPY